MCKIALSNALMVILQVFARILSLGHYQTNFYFWCFSAKIMTMG